MRTPLLALAAAAACVLSTARTANALPFQFNQLGTGAPGTTITGFDLSASNALAQGGNTAVTNFATGGPAAGNTFQLYVQAKLSDLTGPGGTTFAITPGQLTLVASITEVVTGFDPVTHTATFAVAPVQAAGSGLNLYASNTPNLANPATGAGFITGAPILTAVAIPSVQGLLNNFQNNGGAVPFNQSGSPTANPTPLSVNGSGVSTVNFSVLTTNPLYFPGGPSPAIIALHLGSAGANTPFTQVAPSAAFFGPNGVNPPAPNLGTVNGDAPVALGGTGRGGTDVQFQVSGGLAAVPEPTSVVLMGLGLLGVVSFARLRRPQID